MVLRSPEKIIRLFLHILDEAINAVLRGGNRLEKTKKHYGSSFDTEKYKKIADGISKELSKFKLNETLELKRSVGNVDFITGSTSSVDDMIASIGKVYVERGFTSATVCGDTTLPFGGISDTRTTLEIINTDEFRMVCNFRFFIAL